MKTVILLLVLAFNCDVAAQKPKPKPEPEDISQKIQGTVTIRNNDGAVRPAPFVQIHIYEPQRDNLTGLLSAWHAVESKAAEGSTGLSQFSFACQEVLRAAMAVAKSAAVYDRAKKSGNWDEVKEQGLAQYDHFYTDKDGKFEYNIGIHGTEPVPAMNLFGEFLLIAFLNTPTTQYYWEEKITVRQGEKTPPLVLTDPIVCNSSEGAK